ncbi:MAG TPA: UPF0280 family protein [Petrotogaceae bacterium]|jgi:ApbE superfamily uncharacterized protein (UPF0280 family)|nr:UPF0280 family protein [Petrotogaceae bacterium]HNV06139.1 UPF0280 family protein [Petrotogaceae bacterium]
MFEERTYRRVMNPGGLKSFDIKVYESDLRVFCDRDVNESIYKNVCRYRRIIEEYGSTNSIFLTTHEPLLYDINAHDIIRHMQQASSSAGVGPMAGVAGAVAYYASLGVQCQELIIENGGDIYLKSVQDRTVKIHTANKYFGDKIKILVQSGEWGVCTSSGTLGHSFSYGKADAATIIAHDPVLADCVATAACNMVKREENIHRAIEFSMSIEGVEGVVIIIGGKIGIKGKIKLV